ncbi:MAG: OmpA family protein [Sediminicola sp.]|tara:strand:+ start:133663 stop:135726 length:2064 start_codon:yes stop_codon:yes gene_type:complete
MPKRLPTIVLLLLLQIGFGQVKRADRFFESGDYINAAAVYQTVWERDKSKFVLEKLAECYYNTYQYKEAINALSLLVNGRFKEADKYYDNKYNFMHYQFLSAVGDYEKAIDYLVLFKNNRGIKPPRKEEAKDEVETFRLKRADYEVDKVGFNSEAADFAALLHRDTIYFSSDRGGAKGQKYNWTHRPFLDLYQVAVKKEKEGQQLPKSLSQTLNSRFHEGSFCFSEDGNTLYLSRSNIEEGKEVLDADRNNNVQLYVAHKKNGKWGEPVKLPFNSDEYSFEHPALSPDGKRLYFSSNILGSVGSYDLYYVTVNDNGTYGTLKNLSYIINTENREQFPYISPEGHLFFASNGHLGLGMLDIFVSEWVDGKFTKPINLGAPINSRYDDFSLRYNDAETGFFASNRERANDDIYEFTQIGEIFIREYINQFEVLELGTDKYVPNAEVDLFLKDSLIYQNTLDTLARFTNTLLPGSYRFTAKAAGYKDGITVVEVVERNNQKHLLYLSKIKEERPLKDSVSPVANELKKPEVERKSTREQIDDIIKNKPEASQAVINQLLADKDPPKIYVKDDKLYFDMPPIYFDFDRWEIRDDSKRILDQLAAKLTKYPSIYIKISSHTDNRGTDIYNQVLSEKRAESTRNYLALKGYVNARRLSFKGYGESVPLIKCDQNCKEEEHQLNRRSEFEIIKY